MLPAPPRPKRKSCPTTTAEAPKRIRQQFDELLTGELPQLLVEAQHAHVVQVRTLEHAPAFAKIREPRRRVLPRHRYSRGSGSKVSIIAGCASCFASAAGARDQRAVPEVNAIEAADRDGGAAMMLASRPCRPRMNSMAIMPPARCASWCQRACPTANSAAK